MSKLKSLFATISSILICSPSIITLQSNAILVDISSMERYEEYYRFSDTDIIYKALDTSDQSASRFIVPIEENLYNPLGLDFSSYVLTVSEAELISDYLDEQYPEIQLTAIEYDTEYELIYNKNYNAEERLQIGIDIYENTDICFVITLAETMNTIELKPIGDLDGDSAVNALDASLVLTYYSNSQTGNTEIYSDEEFADISLLGDYDGDGAVNALDASLVLKEYAETQTA